MQVRILSVTSLVWCLLAAVQARVATDYATHAETLDGGGGHATSASYGGTGSIGMITGVSTSAAYGLEAGFLPQTGNPLPGPEIAVFDGADISPAAERQSNSDTFLFANTSIGDGNLQTFTIANPGTENLTGLTLSKAGNHPGDFTLGALASTTLAPGATTTFTVTFSPTVSGSRTAVVQIASDDPDENPFVIQVAGAGVVALEAIYDSGTDVPLSASGFTATDSTVVFTLNHAPAVGTELMVVQNTGPDPINGNFNDLAQGQAVALAFGGTTYHFVANYHGGSGNDLVLVWADNQPFAWGNNGSGRLGDNSITQRNQPVAVTDTGVLFGKTVITLAAGATHSMALCSDGTLAAWGRNDAGQLGDGSTTESHVPVAVVTAGTALAGKTVVAIAAGDGHSLALCSDGTVAAWGYNAGGQLGDGTTTQRLLPVAVATVGTPLEGQAVIALAAGRYHSLALCSNGTIAAWGLNFHGELGDNTTTDRHLPVSLSTAGTPLAGRTVIALTAGAYHGLALCSDGTLAAWGDNSHGQLGDGTGTQRNAPVAVNTAGPPLTGRTIVAIKAGSAHSLALCADGSLAAWGNNENGQLGNGFSGQPFTPLPVAVNAQPGISALFGKSVTGIATGAAHSAALCSDGTVATWGANSSGQLGNSSMIASPLAVAVNTGALAPGARFIRVASGCFSDHTLALAALPPLPEISVFTGDSLVNERQNNAGSFGFPITLTGFSSATQTFTIQNTGTSNLSGLVVTKGGGYPDDFTLGSLGATTLAPNASTTFTVAFAPTAAGTRNAVIQIASNDWDENPFAVNVTGTGVVPLVATFNAPDDVPFTASGYNATGQSVVFVLNHAPSVGAELMVVKNTGFSPITGIFSNLPQGQAVALNFGGVIYHFVANYHGGTGNDLVLIRAPNRSFAWGQNANGQLGDSTTTQRNEPVPVTATGVLAGRTLIAQAIGQTHSLALCSDGTLAAWGQNNYGQLGDGTTTQRTAPVAVTTVGTPLANRTVIAIATGTAHSLALCSDGTVVTWGYNNYGQLGDGSATNRSLPTAVATMGTALAGKSVMSIAAGYVFSLALCSDGTVSSWGYNLNGQLGNSTGTNSLAPVAVTTSGALSGKTVVSIAANVNHTLAVCSDGTLAAWGYNFAGELGDNTTTSRFAPVAVLQNSGSALFQKTVVAAAAGEHHSLALCSDGTLASWGQNSSGQLGRGNTLEHHAPVAVTMAGTPLEGKTVTRIAAGTSHSLALCADGTLAAWGKNSSGQIGDSTTTQRNLPVNVIASSLAAGERIIRVTSGSYADHALVLVASAPSEIEVFDGTYTTGNGRQNNTDFDFANTLIGSGNTQTFTIRNTGTTNLTGLAVTTTGSHPGDFTPDTLDATTLTPGNTTTFNVTFSPLASGARSAVLQIASNDTDENPFVINITGTGLSALENWRLTHFNDPGNTNDGADLNDFDHDGIVNLIEFAFGLHPKQNSAGQLPSAQRIDGNSVISFTEPTGISGITFGAEWSATLQPGSWTPIPDTGILPQHTFSLPLGTNETHFMRLRITSP